MHLQRPQQSGVHLATTGLLSRKEILEPTASDLVSVELIAESIAPYCVSPNNFLPIWQQPYFRYGICPRLTILFINSLAHLPLLLHFSALLRPVVADVIDFSSQPSQAAGVGQVR